MHVLTCVLSVRNLKSIPLPSSFTCPNASPLKVLNTPDLQRIREDPSSITRVLLTLTDNNTNMLPNCGDAILGPRL